MENLTVTFIFVTVIGFGATIYFIFKLLNEQKQSNENLISNNKVLSDIKTQLEKIEDVEKAHKLLSKEGFTQIESVLKETIKLD